MSPYCRMSAYVTAYGSIRQHRSCLVLSYCKDDKRYIAIRCIAIRRIAIHLDPRQQGLLTSAYRDDVSRTCISCDAAVSRSAVTLAIDEVVGIGVCVWQQEALLVYCVTRR